MSVFVVVNPRAGSGRTGRRWPDIAAALSGGIGPFDHAFTTGRGHATRLARQAVEAGAELIIAVGGDGTISEAVNGFVTDDGAVRRDCTFAVISAGTGADFVRSLGPSPDPLRGIASGKRRRIDLGRVTYVDDNGNPASRLFINIAGMGLSGEVDRAVNAERMTGLLPGKAAYYIATLGALLRHRSRTVRLTIDDREQLTVDLSMAAIANGQYFGGGMHVAPKARLDSGEFQIVILRGGAKLALARDLRQVYRGAHLDHPMILARTGRHIVAETVDQTGVKVPLDIDGESPGCLKATFEILPGALLLRQ
ncbi:diacylglycerol/lipid kinase family protein [Hoeflea poritis]|uniref:Diacylglycerol kinase family lipid kinase n=1 Tax=Hoeflea poritis TaxID=2993659 RepID=A0ABT4VM27_9HYPH|nr:diacylglycerol kinase family protein [Hoeflea poritis]MDA4845649.1 diacylglycerol kinase family lipid kinase [Hoeflea poritis]